MFVVPPDMPFTKPELLIVATPVLLDTQALEFAGDAVEASCVVDRAQTANEPVMTGVAFTVMVPVAFAVPHPPVSGIE